MANRGVKIELHTDDILKALKEEQDTAFFVGGSVVGDAVEARARNISSHVADRVYVVTRKHARGKPHKKYAAEVARRGGVIISSSSPLTHLLELGTRPHLIPGPVRLPNGAVVRNIQHPGAAARPFVRPALDETKEAATRATADALREQLERRLK